MLIRLRNRTDKNGKDGENLFCWNLFKLVGFFLSQRLTERNKICPLTTGAERAEQFGMPGANACVRSTIFFSVDGRRISATGGDRCSRGGCKECRLHPERQAHPKMGNQSRVIPANAFVALRTDWSKRWPDAGAMENREANGVAHYPGWSIAALKVSLRSAQSHRDRP